MSIGAHMPQHTYRSQKTASVLGPWLPPCLRQCLLLFTAVYARPASPWSPGDSPASDSHLAHVCGYAPPCPALCGSWGSKLRSLHLGGSYFPSPNFGVYFILKIHVTLPAERVAPPAKGLNQGSRIFCCLLCSFSLCVASGPNIHSQQSPGSDVYGKISDGI